MISVAEARHVILARAAPLGPERLPLAEALGRTLRADARADADSPPFDASAMDGYALRRAEASAPLKVLGTSRAGQAFSGALGAGDCVRIFTGAPVPPGADWVVKQEDAVRTGNTVRVPPRDGPTHIRPRGENHRAGDVVVPAGTVLGPPELAALAATGVAEPEVARLPRCAHVVTGHEIVAPDRTPTGAQIRDSNSTLLAALLARLPAALIGQTRVDDDVTAARGAVEALGAHDVLLLSGGAGPGDHDIARQLFGALGYEVHFRQVNLRPGRPLIFASRGAQLAFALPGNPVSHWVVFQLFVAPLLRIQQGGGNEPWPLLHGRLASGSRLPPPDPRPTYWPCRAAVVAGIPELTPLPLASSGDASGLVGANALLPVPPSPGTLDSGQTVEFIPCP